MEGGAALLCTQERPCRQLIAPSGTNLPGQKAGFTATTWPWVHNGQTGLTGTPRQDLSPGARTTRCASSASLAPASQCFILWHQMCQRLSQTVTSSSGDPESQALTPAGVRQLLAKAPLRHIWQKHKQASVSSPEKWGSNSIFPGTDMWTKWDKD